MNCQVRRNRAQTCYLEILRCRSPKETDLPKGYHQLRRSMLCNKRGLEAEQIRAMAYSSCFPSLSITCNVAVSSYRKLVPFFFFFLSNTGRRGRSNKQEERKEYKGGLFQEATHKNCRQPFWTKMGSLIGFVKVGCHEVIKLWPAFKGFPCWSCTRRDLDRLIHAIQ
jgi:hypothetical protein